MPSEARSAHPVMDDDDDAVEPHSRPEALAGFDVTFPGSRGVGWRVAVSREIWSDRPPAGRRSQSEKVAPRIRAFGEAVHAEDRIKT